MYGSIVSSSVWNSLNTFTLYEPAAVGTNGPGVETKVRTLFQLIADDCENNRYNPVYI